MRLTLTYQGTLPSKQRGVSPSKAAIRTEIHPQVKAQVDPRLGNSRRHATTSFSGHDFVAPAHKGLRTAAELDILVLSPTTTRPVGDLDNRLKTLIDGLTKPANVEQMVDFKDPADGGPTYCLLDEDTLVKSLTVDSRRWFLPSADPQLALVIVTAKIVLGDNADLSSPTGNIFMVL